ncbi:MAG: Spy/CpxP family protein refolding chaperone [Methylocystis sp.]|nr:Spy/CpxP family protein refolding chaperone [Methylocystis sp.]MBI3275517.1 Spy/CpxP family protein refolding chaperone [Methylocystis sp.]
MTRGMQILALATILILGGGLGAATAQERAMPEGGGMSMGQGMMGQGMMGQGMMGQGMMGPGMMGHGMMMCHMGEHVEGRLAYLKTELKITEAQTPQWNAFADAFRAVAKKMAQLCGMMKEHGGSMAPASLPERLNMMEEHMTKGLEAMRALKAAVQPLYAILSDEQKKTADHIMKGAP